MYKSKYRESRKLNIRKPLDMLRYVVIHPFAIGAYENCLIMSDGGLVCSTCVKENYKQIYQDTKEVFEEQWNVEAMINESELEEVFCSHCNEALGYHENEEELVINE